MLLTTDSPRPLLLPQNRKVRHLRGIHLRNLSFHRTEGRTVDDAAINQTSSKLDALRDTPQLHHALSSESLRPQKGRRRSSVLAVASPATRQKRLEDAVENRVADVFFELRVDGEPEPIYSSEVIERSTNFNFNFFELDNLNASITRSPRITVEVWTRRQLGAQWTFLIEDHVDLRQLHWLGSPRNAQFPPNSLVFHLIDGIYSLELSNKYPPPKPMPPLSTSSYNALMKLATLDNSIQDALATRDQVAQQINEILQQSRYEQLVTETAKQQEKARLAQQFVAQQKRLNEAQRRRIEELKSSNAARKAAIEAGRAQQAKVEVDVQNAADQLAQSKDLLVKTRASIHGQRRRICEDLAHIFHIVPAPMGPPLAFEICGLSLPNTNYDSRSAEEGLTSEECISAALGHAALVINNLQYYLAVPLPYPVNPYGSRSSVRDDVGKLPDSQREFPLYLTRRRSTAQFRFDYGWFLLNKNIEAICISQGLKVVDIRHTLPNLKYLLYVCSAGREDIPERKRGGFRGLQAGRIKSFGIGDGDTSSLGGSRRGSADSEALAHHRDELRRAIALNGDGHGAETLGPSSSPGHMGSHMPLTLPFEEGDTRLTLRTKGLRENVVS
ncbi:hypothetical protein GQ53DRAFT_742813 [Thozetella sp. PMI_491]|nr:hypothetical protein GQ53DRAFT_742813 [Thozetella sp. PMI_491]